MGRQGITSVKEQTKEALQTCLSGASNSASPASVRSLNCLAQGLDWGAFQELCREFETSNTSKQSHSTDLATLYVILKKITTSPDEHEQQAKSERPLDRKQLLRITASVLYDDAGSQRYGCILPKIWSMACRVFPDLADSISFFSPNVVTSTAAVSKICSLHHDRTGFLNQATESDLSAILDDCNSLAPEDLLSKFDQLTMEILPAIWSSNNPEAMANQVCSLWTSLFHIDPVTTCIRTLRYLAVSRFIPTVISVRTEKL
ncbi:hypothetical protein DFS34DRAFT_37823 [Phlyctochytrium arcticum]|nr:hypothetical protein DFS34DRAFT_37823 [Phlyctochytrium arcticum]